MSESKKIIRELRVVALFVIVPFTLSKVGTRDPSIAVEL